MLRKDKMKNRWIFSPYPTSLHIIIALASLYVSSSSAQTEESMSFFITSESPGNGADLGGLAGADQHCQTLAEAVGAGNRTWRAYLSAQASGDQVAVNARDRIGQGPWYNAQGVLIAQDVDDLHSDSNNLTKETALSEKGGVVNGRGDSPNQHDILTGAQLDGTVFPGDDDLTCQNWTSSNAGSAQLGHHDRQGGGANPTSWNSAHASGGCSQSNLRSTGGNGFFYCFAADPLGIETAVQEHHHTSSPPASAALYQNYPNPFNSETAFRFDLAQRQKVELGVYNLEGQKISTLLNESRSAGSYTVRWDGRSDNGRLSASGTYLYRLKTGNQIETRKLILLR